MGALPRAAPVPQSLSPFLTTTASCPMVVVSRITYSTAQYNTVQYSTVQFVTRCIEAIESWNRGRGLESEGLYRLPGRLR